MLGRNHVIVGMALYLAANRYLESGGGAASALVICLAAAALGSLAPDLDSPKSSLGRRVCPVSRMVKSLVGHRGFTHSLLASFLVFMGLAAARQYHPGWSPYLSAFGIGYFIHVFADWFTTEGVPLFWPNRRRFRGPLSFRTGSLVENLVGLTAGTLLGIWLYQFWRHCI
jgi:inner membrane protein